MKRVNIKIYKATQQLDPKHI